ncbi:MAG: hypothetical protein WA118_06680 [Carboxydocellales bacterium]
MIESNLFHLYVLVFSGILFVSGLYFFFGVGGKESSARKVIGATFSAIGSIIFLLTLIPSF